MDVEFLTVGNSTILQMGMEEKICTWCRGTKIYSGPASSVVHYAGPCPFCVLSEEGDDYEDWPLADDLGQT